MDNGLHFHAVDLHVHTPASNCFGDKSVTPEQIVQEAVDKGIDAIAVTDHNTGDWIDAVKTAAQGTTLTVFPGVEISVAPGIHVVALFDVDRGTDHVNGALAALGIKPEDRGRTETLCRDGLHKVSSLIREWNGLITLAHIDDVKGAFNELSGQDRIQVFNSSWYDAVECIGSSLPDDYDKGHGFVRFPTSYQASDNPDVQDHKKHSLSGMGTRLSLLRLHRNMRLEGLRQCFIDPEVRIRPMGWQCSDCFPCILDMKVVGGFLDGQHAIFNSGLSSIFGGKGAGKSLIIEFLRFALGQSSQDSAILDDHNKKIAKCLGVNGSIQIRARTATGTIYQVTRRDDGSSKCIEETTGTEFNGRIEELFPVLAYSQNEIIKISEAPQAQLVLTDSFVDVGTHRRKISDIQTSLDSSDRDYADALAAKGELDDLSKEAETIRAKITDIDKVLQGSEERARLRGVFDAAKRKKQHYSSFEQYASDIKSQVSVLRQDIAQPAALPGETDEDLIWVQGQAVVVHAGVIKKLDDAVAELETYRKCVDDRTTAYLPAYTDAETKYKETLAADEQRLNKEREKLNSDLAKLTTKIQSRKSRADECPKLQQARTILMDELDRAQSDFYSERKLVYEDLTKQSNSKLRLEVAHAADASEFAECLKDLMSGARVKSDYFREIGEKLSPRKFVDLVLMNDAPSLTAVSSIPGTTAETIVSRLLTAESLVPLLQLQHAFYPKDVPSIKFRKDNGTYAPLDELSVGQKCTALLIIALCRGERPIIIDQPEDALDIKTVWEDVSQKLRQNKTQRQFILTTHNNTVAVSSDTDMMIHVESSSAKATVRCLGRIECAQGPALQVLEGGDAPYRLRNAKYNALN